VNGAEQETSIAALHLGVRDYADAFELQRRLHARVVADDLPNVLLLLEHRHVYTLGRRGSLDDILVTPERLSSMGVEVRDVDRGGQVTYHGPGQLVGYPIVNLRHWGAGPISYVRALEEAIVATLGEFGVRAGREERPTGVWVGDAKIAAIGVKVSRGVTTHGFALNVDPDLSFFDHIVPCGMPDANVTSMASHTPGIGVAAVVPVLARRFAQVFGWRLRWASLEELGESVEGRKPAVVSTTGNRD
jgi:lipoate-protein ligase B